jgi:AAA+ ATPase superfamily predicted ATPase
MTNAPIENPFVFGRIVTGSNFANRVLERSEIKNAAKAGQNVIIHGPRRYGKTSLVEMVAQELRAENFPVAMINAEYVLSKKSLAEALAGAIYHAFNPTMKMFYDAMNILRETFPSIKIKPSEDLPMCIELDEPRKNEDRLLENALNFGEIYAAKRKTKAVIIIDEFPFIEKNVGGNVLHLMRAVMQKQQHTSYVILGSSRTMMGKIFDAKQSPFYKFGKKIEIGEMDEAGLRDFIRRKFLETGISVLINAIEKIISVARRHPYYIQQLCYEIWETTNGGEISEKSISEAAEKIISNERSTYMSILENLTSTQMKVLGMISKSEKIYSEKNISEVGLSIGAVQKAVKILVEKDLIIRGVDCWRIEDPFLSMFMERFR